MYSTSIPGIPVDQVVQYLVLLLFNPGLVHTEYIAGVAADKIVWCNDSKHDGLMGVAAFSDRRNICGGCLLQQ